MGEGLIVRGLSHAYPGSVIFHDVTFELASGQLYGVFGPNGAGKSTLIKILAGILKPRAGDARLDGERLPLGDPKSSREIGVSYIAQEQTLIDSWTVEEQLLYETGRGLADDALSASMKAFGLNLKKSDLIDSLSPDQKQVLEIVKALGRTSRLLLVDEPTTGLDDAQRQVLIDVLLDRVRLGCIVVLISHDLQRLKKFSNSLVAVRDGKVTVGVAPSEVGSEADTQPSQAPRGAGTTPSRGPRLSVKGFGKTEFAVSTGEIVGVNGPLKSGAQHFLREIFGLKRSSVILARDSAKWRPSVSESRKRNIAYISRERQEEWGFGQLAIWRTIAAPAMARRDLFELVRDRTDAKGVLGLMQEADVRPLEPQKLFEQFSGGNQQKAIVSGAISSSPEFLLLDEPISGIDAAARSSLATTLAKLSNRGAGVVVYSQELEDLKRIVDRVVYFE